MSKRRIALLRLVLALAVALLFSAGIPCFGQSGSRHALVIGNGSYRSNTVSALVNPVNDARDVAATLRQLGFSVREIIDGTREQMALAIDGFSRDLKGAEVGLFFFAGHGVQVDGRNYLIPVDAELPSSQVVPFRTIVADEVLAGMSAAGAKLNLFFLDACRDNPLPAESRNLQRGLAVVGNRPPETMIVFATQANATAADGTGRNSPFTQALLRHLPVPALDVYDLFRNVSSEVQGTTGGRQRPEQFGNVTVRYSLASGSLSGTAAPAPGAPAAPSFGNVTVALGSLSITVASAATVSLLGQSVELPAGGILPVNNVTVGDVAVAVRYADGTTENRSVRVEANRSSSVSFDYRPVTVGSLRVSAATAGTVWLDGSQRGTVAAGGSLTLSEVPAGSRRLEIRYADGKSETSTATVSAGGAAVAVAFSYQPVPPSPAPASIQSVSGLQATYKVGDRGPAGGIVFYDKRNISDGWRYLEAWTADESGTYQWKTSQTNSFGTDIQIGTGMMNTRAMAGSDHPAAQVARNARHGGYSDWFLPSLNELKLLYEEKKTIGGFASANYWSSSGGNGAHDTRAWRVSFFNGYQNTNSNKDSKLRVRVVRAFSD
jgi:hypothetical protein